MRKLVLVVLGLMICGNVFGATIEIPDDVTEEQAKAWIARLYMSYKQAKANDTPEYIAKIKQGQQDVDAYLTKIGLPTQYTKPVEAEPIVEG